MTKGITLPMSKQTFNTVTKTLNDVLGDPDYERWVIAPQELGIKVVLGGRTFVGCHLIRGWNCGCEVDFDFGNDPEDGRGLINLALCRRHQPLTDKIQTLK
jgi:hypothetical protein